MHVVGDLGNWRFKPSKLRNCYSQDKKVFVIGDAIINAVYHIYAATVSLPTIVCGYLCKS